MPVCGTASMSTTNWSSDRSQSTRKTGVERCVPAARHAEPPDQRQPLIHCFPQGAVFVMVRIGAAHLVAVQAIDANGVVVRPRGSIGCIDGPKRQRSVELRRLPDPLLGWHEAQCFAGELEVAGVVLGERFLAGCALSIKPAECGVSDRQLTSPLIRSHVGIVAAIDSWGNPPARVATNPATPFTSQNVAGHTVSACSFDGSMTTRGPQRSARRGRTNVRATWPNALGPLRRAGWQARRHLQSAGPTTTN